MDKIFKGMIGKSVEVYVDDIVVKSDSCGQHVRDLQEVFDALRGWRGQVSGIHADSHRNWGQPWQMQGDNWDEKPKKSEGNSAATRPVDSIV